MKKMIFSAIAMMAFVGTSMANDIADEKITEEASSAELSRCAKEYLDMYRLLSDAGYSDKMAGKGAWMHYSACVDQHSLKQNDIKQQ